MRKIIGKQLRLRRTVPGARPGLEGLELVKAILDDWRYGRAMAAETLAALDAAVPDDREPDAGRLAEVLGLERKIS